METLKKIIDFLKRLGILKVGAEVNKYKSSKDEGYKVEPMEND